MPVKLQAMKELRPVDKVTNRHIFCRFSVSCFI
jgi:hypothetical protein